MVEAEETITDTDKERFKYYNDKEHYADDIVTRLYKKYEEED